MKNEKRYKETFSAIFPSEDAVERIYEITNDKKKFYSGKAIKRILAAALALILVFGGGFGIDYIVEKSRIINSNNTLGVYVAYGSERELVKLDSNSVPPVFYRVYVIKDKYSEEKQKQIKDERKQDMKNQVKIASKFDQGAGGNWGYIEDKSGECGEVCTVSSGEFFLDIKDYSKVDKITIEDNSDNGKMIVDLITKKPNDFNEENSQYIKLDDMGNYNTISKYEVDDNPDLLYESRFNDKVVITGDELRFSRNSGLYTLGVGENKINTGYYVYWNQIFTLKFYDDIDFNIRKIKGSIVFTVDYIDGSTEQSTVNYHFDKNGYMILSMK